jgi:quercetin dioxygenase-like cupin family protein
MEGRKMATIQNWSTIQKAVVREGMSQRVFLGKNTMMALNEVTPGTAPNLHFHPQEQLVYVMEGEADCVLGDEVLAMKAGDLVVVSPNIPHCLKVKGTKPCLSLEVFSPVPDKFLPSQK